MSMTENFDPLDDQYLDEDDDDMPPPTGRGRLPALTAGLVVAVVATVGFFSGVVVQKHVGKVKTTNTLAALATAGATGNAGAAASALGTAAAAGRTGAAAGGAAAGGAAAGGAAAGGATGAASGTGTGGAGGGARAGGGRTIGIVTDVTGDVMTITNAQGDPVKIQIGATSKITKTDPGTVADLKLGLTVVVTGQAGPDGTVAATAISIGAAGGGFGGGGFGGGGFGGGGGSGASGSASGG